MQHFRAAAALWVLLFFAMGINPAAAYLDPGTGSIILQAVIGAVAGALIVIKLYWYKLLSFLRTARTGTGNARAMKDGDEDQP